MDILLGHSVQVNENHLVGGYGRKAPSDLIHYVSWYENVYDVNANRVLKDFHSDKERSTMVVRATELQLPTEVFRFRHREKGCLVQIRRGRQVGHLPVVCHRVRVLGRAVHGMGRRDSGFREDQGKLREVGQAIRPTLHRLRPAYPVKVLSRTPRCAAGVVRRVDQQEPDMGRNETV